MPTTRSPRSLGALASAAGALCLLLSGCGEAQPPIDLVEQRIEEAVFADNRAVYDAGAEGGEVRAIVVGPWKKRPEQTDLPPFFDSEWTATLRTKEPLALIEMRLDGTNIVRVVAPEGHEIAFEGTAGGMHADGEWHLNASATGSSLDGSRGPWVQLLDSVGGITMGYQVETDGQTSFAGRGVAFLPLSKLQPYVATGSPEHEQLMAERARRMRAAQEAHQAEVQRQRQAAEAQRAAQEAAYLAEQKQREEEREATQKKAQAEAAEHAEAARRARMTPFVEPFRSPHGAVITTDAGPAMGQLLLEANVDDRTLAVTGRGVELRAMPFADFTFAGAFDERGIFSLTLSSSSAPLVVGQATAQGLAGRGFRVATLSEPERAELDALVALGTRLQASGPAALGLETLDAATAKAREATLDGVAMPGIAIFQQRKNDSVAAMFTPLANGRYRWTKEPVVLRLNVPLTGKGIYLKGGAAPTDNLGVIINGVHRIAIPAIERYGAAFVSMPSDLEVLDLRLEAGGTAVVRGAVLVK